MGVKRTKASAGAGRYRSLMAFIAAFVMIIVGVLAVNFYVSAQFAADALEINLAGRQRMLTQRTMKALQNVVRAEQSGQTVEKELSELRSAFTLFSNTLNAFDRGGETLDASGNKITLDPAENPDARAAINEAQALFAPYSETLAELTQADSAILQHVADATAATVQVTGPLLTATNAFTEALSKTNAPSSSIDLAGRQRMLSQKISNHMLAVPISQLNDQPVEKPLQQLRESVALFDSTLSAFELGGQATTINGRQIQLAAVSEPAARAALNETRGIWNEIEGSVKQLTQATIDDQKTLNLLASGVRLGTSANNQLLALMNQLTVALEAESSSRSNVLRWIQVGGILLALAMFGFIVFGFLRQLGKSDSELDEARNETEQILDTVKDGLFLMDNDMNIGTQHSTSLSTIINERQPGGKNFLGLLEKIVPEKTLTTARDYVDLLFGDRVNEELVTDLNPLDEVEVFFEGDDGEHDVRHLEFSFKRAKVGDATSHLLVQVDDISERVKLERELDESREQAQEQFDLMLKVLHVEPALLTHFLNQTDTRLAKINGILRKRSESSLKNREKLDEIYRLMHSIKGDAAALDLEAFADKAHAFENMLEELRVRSNLQGGDFLNLTIRLDEFMSQNESLRELIHRLGDLQSIASSNSRENFEELSTPSPIGNGTQLSTKLRRFAQRLAEDEGKKLTIEIEGEEKIPEEKADIVDEVLTQMLRNAVVHGLETPQERQERGKGAKGQINISVSKLADNEIDIVFRDDGRGLSLNRIKAAAVSKDLVTAKQAASMDKRQTVSLIFKPGFSTAIAGKNAGRGVGMDIVASRVKELGGRLGLKTDDGKGCEFRIRMPLAQEQRSETEEIA
ncbi:MAG: type IV pili methyl-accepting chemotaxis transducer N-terminal domain-containing protein [Lysobacterales bacterium]